MRTNVPTLMKISRTFYDPSSKHLHFISQSNINREINYSVSEAHEAVGGAVEKLQKDAHFTKHCISYISKKRG